MKEVIVYDIGSYPVCLDCRHAMVDKSEGWTEVGCTKVVSSTLRDFITGENVKHNAIQAMTCRAVDNLCSLEGKWFEPKA